MTNALNNQVGMLGNMFLWLVANLKQGVIYFIKQALPPNISAGSVATYLSLVLLLITNLTNGLHLHQFLVTKSEEANKSVKTDANGAH